MLSAVNSDTEIAVELPQPVMVNANAATIKVITLIVAALAFTMTGCGSSTAISVSELTAESKPAPQYTIDANQEVYALLDFEDTAAFENATNYGLV